MSATHTSIPKAGAGADLRRFMEKRIDGNFLFLPNFEQFFPLVKLNADRHVVGVVRGYDQFMNLVLDNAVSLRVNIYEDEHMIIQYYFIHWSFTLVM